MIRDWTNEEYCLERVKQDGWSIQFMKKPSKQVQLEAVKQDGWSIRFIENPSRRVILMAIQNGLDNFDLIHISEEKFEKIKQKYPEYFI